MWRFDISITYYTHNPLYSPFRPTDVEINKREKEESPLIIVFFFASDIIWYIFPKPQNMAHSGDNVANNAEP